jgi:hypothetical protein
MNKQELISFKPSKHSLEGTMNTGIFTIQIASSDNSISENKIWIFNFTGSTVYSTITNQDKLNIDLSLYSKGIYLIEVHSTTKHANQKIIIQ